MKQERSAQAIQAELEFLRRMAGRHDLNQPRGGWPERLPLPLILTAIYTASGLLSFFILAGLYHYFAR